MEDSVATSGRTDATTQKVSVAQLPEDSARKDAGDELNNDVIRAHQWVYNWNQVLTIRLGKVEFRTLGRVARKLIGMRGVDAAEGAVDG